MVQRSYYPQSPVLRSMAEQSRRLVGTGTGVFLSAFTIRLVAVVITTLSDLNTYATYDADRFARSAAVIASTLASGTIPSLSITDVHDVWGLILSPFWLLPGPSRFFAQVGIAVLGAIAVYNLYAIALRLHSRRAGLIAALPLMIFPSVVAVQSTVLRDAAVLFGITTCARLLIGPSAELPDRTRYCLATVAVALATVLRPENLPLYLLAIGTGIVASIDRSFRSPLVACLGLATVGSTAVTGARAPVQYLARLRRYRARGRTEYLSHVIPESLPSMIAFGWIGVTYFLYSPFPWMITDARLLVVGLESFATLGGTVFAILGVRATSHRFPAVTGGLLAGFLTGVTLYGIVTANVGTALRHRQMFTWVVFVFGGVWIAGTVRVVRDANGTRQISGDSAR